MKPKQITKLCDIYSIGAIIFKLLLGRAPTLQISQFIADNNLHETTPDSNVYEIPYFFKDFILSNDMCQICVKLLHQSPKHRFQSLSEVREELAKLMDNITQTPTILR